nr:hypothetical protein [Tanacetum cinerariifolium]
AFLVTADVPEIYMQEFWEMAKLHQHFIRFKMDTRKSVLDLEAFREMLHISPRIPSQSFAEFPFKEEILEDKTDESDDGNDDDNDETVKAGSESDEDDDNNNDEEELAKNDDEDTESGKGGDEVSESKYSDKKET